MFSPRPSEWLEGGFFFNFIILYSAVLGHDSKARGGLIRIMHIISLDIVGIIAES